MTPDEEAYVNTIKDFVKLHDSKNNGLNAHQHCHD